MPLSDCPGLSSSHICFVWMTNVCASCLSVCAHSYFILNAQLARIAMPECSSTCRMYLCCMSILYNPACIECPKFTLQPSLNVLDPGLSPQESPSLAAPCISFQPCTNLRGNGSTGMLNVMILALILRGALPDLLSLSQSPCMLTSIE